MGKGSAFLGVLALLISIGFGGYFLYDKFIAIPPADTPAPTGNQWYDQTTSVEYMAPSEAWDTHSYLSIDFNVSSGETVYFSYVGHVLLDDGSGPSYVEIKFVVDGIRWYYPYVRVWRYNELAPGGVQLSVALQHYNTTMPAGNHTVTIAFKGDSTGDAIYLSNSLFVQTFN